VQREAREAHFVAAMPDSSILVVAPAPYRMEWEILSRSVSYRYASEVDEGGLWVDLTAGGKRYLFLRVIRRHRRAEPTLPAACRFARLFQG
jgi:hypothetical protein